MTLWAGGHKQHVAQFQHLCVLDLVNDGSQVCVCYSPVRLNSINKGLGQGGFPYMYMYVHTRGINMQSSFAV